MRLSALEEDEMWLPCVIMLFAIANNMIAYEYEGVALLWSIGSGESVAAWLDDREPYGDGDTPRQRVVFRQLTTPLHAQLRASDSTSQNLLSLRGDVDNTQKTESCVVFAIANNKMTNMQCVL